MTEIVKIVSSLSDTDLINDNSFDEFATSVKMSMELTRAEDALFHSNVDNHKLWQVYLESFSDEISKQHHNCRCCKDFIIRYGDLIKIDDDGIAYPVLWDIASDNELFRYTSKRMAELFINAKAISKFIPSDQSIGHDVTHSAKTGIDWSHLQVKIPDNLYVRSRTGLDSTKKLHENVAHRTHLFETVFNALLGYKQKMLDDVVNILKSGIIKDGKNLLPQAIWLRDLKDISDQHGGIYKVNVVWKWVANAPEGFCHPKASVFGSLIDDLEAGFDVEACTEKFAKKVNPINYKRPVAPPSEATIDQANKLIDALDLRDSLLRRSATPDDLKFFWESPVPKDEPIKTNGVFDSLKQNLAESTIDGGIVQLPMTIRSFIKNILPNAESVEIAVNNSIAYNFVGYLTAVNPDSPPILKYDKPDARNTVSTYYIHGGALPMVFGLNPGWHKVIGLAHSPEFWNKEGVDCETDGNNITFVIEKCYHRGLDALALFPDDLIPELYSVRSVIEAYSNNHKPVVLDNAVGGITVARNPLIIRCKVGRVITAYNIVGIS